MFFVPATTFTKLFVATGATARSFNDASPELLDDVEIVDLVGERKKKFIFSLESL